MTVTDPTHCETHSTALGNSVHFIDRSEWLDFNESFCYIGKMLISEYKSDVGFALCKLCSHRLC